MTSDPIKIDVHLHSNVSSDGELPPTQLMRFCAEKAIRLVALCDHNSMAGVPEAEQTAKTLGLAFLPAAEINCQTDDGTEIHLIGYGIGKAIADVERLGEIINRVEEDSNFERLAVLEGFGLQINRESLEKIRAGRILAVEMIAEAILSDPANYDHPMIQPYLPGGTKSDQPLINFYWDMCTAGKPAYVPVRYPSLKDALTIVKDHGGIGVVAHPGKSIARGQADRIIEEMVQAGIAGFEVYSSYHSESMTAFYRAAVLKHRLGMTVGSDFHGAIKPTIEIGSVSCEENCQQIFRFLEPYIA